VDQGPGAGAVPKPSINGAIWEPTGVLVAAHRERDARFVSAPRHWTDGGLRLVTALVREIAPTINSTMPTGRRVCTSTKPGGDHLSGGVEHLTGRIRD
jgi:hypothetical protein